MTLQEIDNAERKLAEIDLQIEKLIRQRWEIVTPDGDEVQTALELLRDDPYNQIAELLEGNVGMWLVPDEVLCARRIQIEEQEEANWDVQP